MMLASVDTGFFFALEENDSTALKIWKEREIITSAIVLYELQKKLLQGHFRKWRTVIDDIKLSTFVISHHDDIALNAAHISHKYHMPGLDALILASLLDAGAKEIYTTDAHFDLFKSHEAKIINLAS